MDELLPIALDINITISQFFEYDLEEIQLIIESFNRKTEVEMKQRAEGWYHTALLTAMFVGLSLDGDDVPDIEEVFPQLYDQGEYEKKVQSKQLAEFENLVRAFNSQRKKNNG